MDRKAPWYYLVLLILAGECVFILPFVLSRVFRPTVLETFQMNNLELGLCYSVYGFVSVLSYLFGGPIADRFSPRKLIAIALWLTALGGLVYATFPSFGTLQILYGYWGFTTIFLFWAPMIKATRVWGGDTAQGKAFGFLDGGRGLVGALFGALGVLIFALFIPTDTMSATFLQKKEAFRYVILASSFVIAMVGVLVWFFMKLKNQPVITISRITKADLKEVLMLPSVVLLMVIISCAYVGYKITDIFSLYAEDVMKYDSVQSAQFGTFLLFVRPIVGVAFGILADRSRITHWLVAGFVISILGGLLFASGIVTDSSSLLFFLSVSIVATGIYAVRALYYGVMDKGQIPLRLTGTAVGIISVIGYTPDIFAGPAMGYLLDENPGIEGQKNVFWMFVVFSLIGGLAAYRFLRLYGTNKAPSV